MFPKTEKSRRNWAFMLISIAWLGATFVVVGHLAPKSVANANLRLASLNRNEVVMQEQQDLLEKSAELYSEIKSTRFQIYQMYVVNELREKINAIHQKGSRVESHSQRISNVLLLLLNAREELVAKQRNLVVISAHVQNCREGNQDIQID